MNILFIGCGLIGGGIAKALLGKAEIYTITTQKIEHDGIKSFTNANEIPNVEFDIICIATPRGKNFEIYELAFEIAEKLSSKKTQIVDISSVQNQNAVFQKKYPNFIPCHPIAGTEKTGFENSNPQIISGKNCIIIGENVPDSVVNFWQNAGMKTIFLPTTEKHDQIFAKISHLPQLISFNMLPRKGFDSFYRLCNSPLSIWQETFLHNKIFIQNALDEFQIHFTKFQNTNFSIEKIISSCFLNYTNAEEKSFAGSGFKTITSAIDIPNIHTNEYHLGSKILEKSQEFLQKLQL